jgi:biopolymer transport protein ExbD
MAEISENNSNKGGKKRARKQSTRVDMTPMVDLAFLLLTFFVLTSTFTKPKAMELSMPAEGEPSPVKNGLTFLLTKDNRVFYYKGEFVLPGDPTGRKPTELTETNYSDVHTVLLKENKWALDQKKKIASTGAAKRLTDSAITRQVNEMMGNKEAVTVLVKTDNEATYKNAVDMLDELKIADVGKRVIGVEMMKPEYELVQEKIK